MPRLSDTETKLNTENDIYFLREILYNRIRPHFRQIVMALHLTPKLYWSLFEVRLGMVTTYEVEGQSRHMTVLGYKMLSLLIYALIPTNSITISMSFTWPSQCMLYIDFEMLLGAVQWFCPILTMAALML